MPIIIEGEQRSDEWYEARRGKVTCSNASVIMNGSPSQWKNYMDDLRAERQGGALTGKDISHVRAIKHGTDTEQRAVSMYELEKGVPVTRVMLVQHDKLLDVCGSPDGLILNHGKRTPKLILGGVEAKCPFKQEIHEQTLRIGMPERHTAQVQSLIWLCETPWWDFVSYAPYMADHTKRLYVQRITRDNWFIQRWEERLGLFLSLFNDGVDPVEHFTKLSVVKNLL